MTQSEIEKLLAKTTISVTEAAAVVGLSRNGAYEAVSRGEIQTIRFGRSIKVPTAPLRKMLGLEAVAAAAAAQTPASALTKVPVLQR